MPIPKPEPQEERAEFLGRCFNEPLMEEEYPDTAQRYAVCVAAWESVEEKAGPFGDYPKSARNQAKRALKHKKENGSNCGTSVGWARARQLSAGEALSLSVVKRTYSFLSRAKVYDKGKFTDEDGKEICGSVMYAAWGGDSMLNWCERTLKREEA